MCTSCNHCNYSYQNHHFFDSSPRQRSARCVCAWWKLFHSSPRGETLTLNLSQSCMMPGLHWPPCTLQAPWISSRAPSFSVTFIMFPLHAGSPVSLCDYLAVFSAFTHLMFVYSGASSFEVSSRPGFIPPDQARLNCSTSPVWQLQPEDTLLVKVVKQSVEMFHLKAGRGEHCILMSGKMSGVSGWEPRDLCRSA